MFKSFLIALTLYLFCIPIGYLLKKLQPTVKKKLKRITEPDDIPQKPVGKTTTKIYYVTDKEKSRENAVKTDVAIKDVIFAPDEFRKIQKD